MKELASLARLDGLAQAELCARGEVSADELFDACLARIDALNPRGARPAPDPPDGEATRSHRGSQGIGRGPG